MNHRKNLHYLAIAATLGIIATCFIPWVHYNNIGVTFNGFNVKKFPTGVYYGRAGIIITGMAAISLVFVLLQSLVAKRVNMFLCALLVAYTLRTYVIFTGSLFDGEVEKLAGIYLIVFLSFVMVTCSVFPYLKKEEGFE